MMRACWILLALVVLLFSLQVEGGKGRNKERGQGGGATKKQKKQANNEFNKLDKDGNGALTKAELSEKFRRGLTDEQLAKKVANIFKNEDKNNNNFLDMAEFNNIRAKKKQKLFGKGFDFTVAAGSDNKLNQEETKLALKWIQKVASNILRRTDSNDDNFIEKSEFDKLPLKAKNRVFGKNFDFAAAAGDDNKMNKAELIDAIANAEKQRLSDLAQTKIDKWDKNGNQQIEKSEYPKKRGGRRGGQ